MKRAAVLMMLICLACLPLAGCYQTGKTAGEAVKSVEQGAKDVQKGYEDGKKKD